MDVEQILKKTGDDVEMPPIIIEPGETILERETLLTPVALRQKTVGELASGKVPPLQPAVSNDSFAFQSTNVTRSDTVIKAAVGPALSAPLDPATDVSRRPCSNARK